LRRQNKLLLSPEKPFKSFGLKGFCIFYKAKKIPSQSLPDKNSIPQNVKSIKVTTVMPTPIFYPIKTASP